MKEYVKLGIGLAIGFRIGSGLMNMLRDTLNKAMDISSVEKKTEEE